MAMSNPMYRCHDCHKKHKKDPVKRAKHVKNMACEVYVTKPRHKYRPEHNNKGNPEVHYTHCVGNYFNNYWAYWINFTDNFTKGFLPFPGTILEQPNKFVDAMNLVQNLKSEDQQCKDAKVKQYGGQRSKR